MPLALLRPSPPCCRIVPDDGTGLVGLPSVRLFGALLKSQHLLMLAAATLFMGWRGALLGAVVW